MCDINQRPYGPPSDTPHEVWEQRSAGFNLQPPQPPHCEPEKCTPVPPPIPPVRYVPGMNVQEQLCNMAERVNVSINRWNQIQANCYKALDEVVGAAVNNDVYYAPDEVRFMEGYDEAAGCSYSIVEARAVDRSGKPIFCHLRAAYNNETNSGAREPITDVSFVTSAQMVISAVQATETRWKGTTVFNGNPGASTPDDTVWVCGWTRNGVLRFFSGDVSEGTLRQNRMVNCIGPVFPILKDSKPFEEVLGAMGEEPGSIQAIGWKPNGNKVFFNCGVYDEPGMTPTQVMKTMQSMGCTTAVITSYQVQAATAWDETPIAGTEARGSEDPSVITAPGMTGGMTFLGKLTASPIQWNIPQNCAAWVISKKPAKGWHNAFTTEVANVVQRLGNQENSMNSILGQLKGENTAISKLQYDVQQNADNIASVKETVDTFDERINGLDARITTAENNINQNVTDIAALRNDLTAEVNTSAQEVAELRAADAQEKQERVAADAQEKAERVAADNQEKAERQAADNALRASINAEAQARESADTVLQNNIDEEANVRSGEDAKLRAEIDTEATTRAQADRNLQAAIEAETSARSTKDTQHEARMDAIEAQEQKDKAELKQDIQDVNDAIDTLKDGSGLPIATTEQLGAIRVGANLTITEDGTLNAKAGGGEGGDTVKAGVGIVITDTAIGEKEISVEESVRTGAETATLLAPRVAANETKIAEITERVETAEGQLGTLGTRYTELSESLGQTKLALESTDIKVDANKQNIETLNTVTSQIEENVDAMASDIHDIHNGVGIPYATTTEPGVIKVGANLSIDENGVLSAAGGGGEPGETVAAGNGINVVHQDGVATVSIKDDVQSAIDQIPAIKTETDKIPDIQTAVDQIPAIKEEVDKIVEAGGELQIQNGVGIEIDTETESGKAIIGINQDTQTKINNAAEQAAQATVDNARQDREMEQLGDQITQVANETSRLWTSIEGKVSRAGDTMTGSLQFNGTEEGRSLTLSDGGIVLNDTTTIYGDNGQVNFSNQGESVVIGGVADAVAGDDAVNKKQLDAVEQLAEDAVADAASALTKAQAVEGTANSALQQAETATNTANAVNGIATEAKTTATEAKTIASGLDGRMDATEASVASLGTAVDGKVSKSGDTMTGTLNGKDIKGTRVTASTEIVLSPGDQDATILTKAYGGVTIGSYFEFAPGQVNFTKVDGYKMKMQGEPNTKKYGGLQVVVPSWPAHEGCAVSKHCLDAYSSTLTATDTTGLTEINNFVIKGARLPFLYADLCFIYGSFSTGRATSATIRILFDEFVPTYNKWFPLTVSGVSAGASPSGTMVTYPSDGSVNLNFYGLQNNERYYFSGWFELVQPL